MYERPRLGFAVTILAAATLASGMARAATAPAPSKPVDAARFYSGLWHEIGRHPMALTDGCVAGATEYHLKSPTTLDVNDTCHDKTPDGKIKAIGGPATILDPGENAKIHVSYRFFGPFRVGVDYWVLDHADDYSWFISSDPTFKNLWIYTRDPDISPQLRQSLVERARSLGYDVSKLEFPAQP
jgi:apolipoprotein D and lipocalin family protein